MRAVKEHWMKIQLSIEIGAPRQTVWNTVKDVRTHIRWMADAKKIHLTSPQPIGIGTTFDCETRIGPLRTTDRMSITEWEEARVMGIRHSGIITGQGRFLLTDNINGGTKFTWEEELHFPWWAGGFPAAGLARVLLLRIWRKNLQELARIVENGNV